MSVIRPQGDASIIRAGLTLGAQSLASVTNFAVAALALSAGDLRSFGLFAIAFQLCQIVVVVTHGSIGDSVLIHTSRDAGDGRAQNLRDGAATTALLLGLLSSGLFVVGAAVAPDLRPGLLIAAVGAPAITAQYTLRARRFADANPGGVVVVDAVWLGVVVGGALVDLVGWDATPNGYLAVWLLGAAVSGAPTILTGLTRGRAQLRAFWTTAGSQMLRLGAEGLLARSVFVVSLIATEIVVDTAASGTLAAAVLVFSPMSVVQASASAIVVPAEVARRGIHVVRLRVPVGAALAVIAITCAWALVVATADFIEIGPGPFDLDRNGITGWLFLATLLRFGALGAWRGSLIGMRIADEAGESLRARLVGSIAQWVLPVVGLFAGGLEGGALGLGIGTCIGAAEAWRRYLELRVGGQR